MDHSKPARRIEQKQYLAPEDHERILELSTLCARHDNIALKLELDFKLADAAHQVPGSRGADVDEFLYYDNGQLIGYFGICSFGGIIDPPELTGMVHPARRCQGVFSQLLKMAMEECKRRSAETVRLLCDHNSTSGREFLDQTGAVYSYSEYELHWHPESNECSAKLRSDITFRKASNADAGEIARQNAIYFRDHDEAENEKGPTEALLLPEEEEKKGMTIWLAEMDGVIIGKVHLQLTNGVGGIYGLGILPQFRGKGYGRTILQKSVEILRESPAQEILLQVDTANGTALNLYKSCGFQVTSVMDYYTLNTQLKEGTK
jgi:ribosomal protein S18 acetylase RimI-like enzyme